MWSILRIKVMRKIKNRSTPNHFGNSILTEGPVAPGICDLLLFVIFKYDNGFKNIVFIWMETNGKTNRLRYCWHCTVDTYDDGCGVEQIEDRERVHSVGAGDQSEINWFPTAQQQHVAINTIKAKSPGANEGCFFSPLSLALSVFVDCDLTLIKPNQMRSPS